AVRGRNTAYVRPIDGGPAVRIGEGHARGMPFTRDGRAVVLHMETHLEMLPVGVGQPRIISLSEVELIQSWAPTADNERLIALANLPGQPQRLYEMSVATGSVRQISDIPAGWPARLSNDDQTAAAMDDNDRVMLFPIADGEPREANGCLAGDVPIGWTPDDKALYVYRRGRTSVLIERVDITTGERTPWHTIRP